MDSCLLKSHRGGQLNRGIGRISDDDGCAGGLAWTQDRSRSDELYCRKAANGAGGIHDSDALRQTREHHRDGTCNRAVSVIGDRERRVISLADAAVEEAA